MGRAAVASLPLLSGSHSPSRANTGGSSRLRRGEERLLCRPPAGALPSSPANRVRSLRDIYLSTAPSASAFLSVVLPCSFKPQGHHAGPLGPVSPDLPPGQGSHGFCLINNVALAAAYARRARPSLRAAARERAGGDRQKCSSTANEVAVTQSAYH